MATLPSLHLRSRGEDGVQQITAVELLFDLVFVFAITGLSHLVVDDLTVDGLLRAGFLLLVVWWAWINTTWLANWLDPGSTRVQLLLVAATLLALLLATSLPEALDEHGLLFAASYVGLQVGRNLCATFIAPAEHHLRRTFGRLLFWSVVAGTVWIVGGLVDPEVRLLVWGVALMIDLAAPILGYPTPRLGRTHPDDYDVDGAHFAERCQGFVIIALGESIVVTGATAADVGLTAVTVVSLCLAFLGTAALWWLYFDLVAGNSVRDLSQSGQTGRLARDAYTYLHIPIVAGIILVAVSDDLLLAHPTQSLDAIGAFTVLGGPALFLAGETLFRLRMIGSVSPGRLSCIAALTLAAVFGTRLPALALVGFAIAALVLLAVAETYAHAAFVKDQRLAAR